jgi:hypothetical protein
MRVLVLDKNKKPLDPCPTGTAWKLLKRRRAAVFLRFPFTIILKDRTVEESVVHPHRFKVDPGSKVTGVAVVQETTGTVVVAAEIEHRGQRIKAAMESRRASRRSRRARKTRYRKPRFDNRTRRDGWLPPSLESRIGNILTWVDRLRRCCPISAISQELVKFDLQQMENPEIGGVEYQQGTLAGYAGTHVGRVAVRSTGSFQIGTVVANARHVRVVQRSDGYSYTQQRTAFPPHSSS